MSDHDGDRGPSDKTPSERRIGTRYLACFPAYVEQPEGRRRTALIHNLSTSGALLLTQRAFEIGETIRLELFITPDNLQNSVHVTAHVSRLEVIPIQRADVWSHRVGVHFDAPLDAHESEVKDLAERQKQLGFMS